VRYSSWYHAINSSQANNALSMSVSSIFPVLPCLQASLVIDGIYGADPSSSSVLPSSSVCMPSFVLGEGGELLCLYIKAEFSDVFGYLCMSSGPVSDFMGCSNCERKHMRPVPSVSFLTPPSQFSANPNHRLQRAPANPEL